MEKSLFNEIVSFLEDNHIPFKEDYQLKKVSSFKIGGNAALAVFPEDENVFCLLLSFLGGKKCRYCVLGNVSNILVDDKGYDGVAVFTSGMKKLCLTDENLVYAQCGVSLTALCKFTSELSLTGGEGFYGIPGTVGGAVYMNAGAYGYSMSDVVRRVEVYDAVEDKKTELTLNDMNFGYRHSICSEKEYYIIGVYFQFNNGAKEEILSQMNCFMSKRKNSQPLEYPSAGSVFKRPEGYYTGKIIEESGLKGFSIGDAEISEKHAGFIINKGNASSNDVKELVKYIQEEIKKNYGIDLECEIIFL